MLKKIPSNLSPELVKILMEMGHGDELVISDANFPGERIGKRVVRADGQSAVESLQGILELLPLDAYSDYQYALMETVGNDGNEPPIWSDFSNIIDQHYSNSQVKHLERFEFYEKSEDAFAILITGETALYGNIILKKGVI